MHVFRVRTQMRALSTIVSSSPLQRYHGRNTIMFLLKCHDVSYEMSDVIYFSLLISFLLSCLFVLRILSCSLSCLFSLFLSHTLPGFFSFYPSHLSVQGCSYVGASDAAVPDSRVQGTAK